MHKLHQFIHMQQPVSHAFLRADYSIIKPSCCYSKAHFVLAPILSAKHRRYITTGYGVHIPALLQIHIIATKTSNKLVHHGANPKHVHHGANPTDTPSGTAPTAFQYRCAACFSACCTCGNAGSNGSTSATASTSSSVSRSAVAVKGHGEKPYCGVTPSCGECHYGI